MTLFHPFGVLESSHAELKGRIPPHSQLRYMTQMRLRRPRVAKLPDFDRLLKYGPLADRSREACDLMADIIWMIRLVS